MRLAQRRFCEVGNERSVPINEGSILTWLVNVFLLRGTLFHGILCQRFWTGGLEQGRRVGVPIS
jgi:hypothetical protein